MTPPRQPSAEDSNPQRRLVRALLNSIRSYQHHKTRRGAIALVMRKLARLRYEVLSVLTGSDVGITAKFGTNFRLPHPVGVVVHERAVIGDDCMFMQQVTIGILADHRVPTIGSRVYIGTGAKVLGHVSIGDDARIGANAVVLSDVPAGATAVGIPARIIVRKSHEAPSPEPK
ncbi:serine O-acetyltransferase [Piscinibacter terrae]|uniref:Serine acetyltransferase n=1 Tax=Piscinibacter terrae TaxID=2496871 RepID=A0A3N7J6A7_9BURK|nr:serine O-acetyltransferase [Albitalea terrae]RQP26342.1 serine acetyltransferase [Albitalea terrae]